MAALVLKKWKVKNTPVDQAGNYVDISGRQSGLIAWVLALVGIDPTTTLKISKTRIEFQTTALSGTISRMIPLQGVCSTYYGYRKPWKQAIGVFIVCSFLFNFLAVYFFAISFVHKKRDFYNTDFSFSVGIVGLLGLVAAIIIALLYYFLNRTLMIGFVEKSGLINAIKFKRSVIENIDVDELHARSVCELTQSIIESVQNKGPKGSQTSEKPSSGSPAPQMASLPECHKILFPVTVDTPNANFAACPECGAMLDCPPDVHNETVICDSCGKPFQVH